MSKKNLELPFVSPINMGRSLKSHREVWVSTRLFIGHVTAHGTFEVNDRAENSVPLSVFRPHRQRLGLGEHAWEPLNF